MDFGSKSAVLEFACIGLAVLGLFLQSPYSQLCRTLNTLLLISYCTESTDDCYMHIEIHVIYLAVLSRT